MNFGRVHLDGRQAMVLRDAVGAVHHSIALRGSTGDSNAVKRAYKPAGLKVLLDGQRPNRKLKRAICFPRPISNPPSEDRPPAASAGNDKPIAS